jgi:hypothetical protein
MVQAVDLTPAVLGEDGITLKPGQAMHLGINITYDPSVQVVRVHVIDALTENYADRTVTDSMLAAGDGVKLPIRMIYDMIPSAIEEIVVMNRLLGKVEVKGSGQPEVDYP